MKNTKKPIAHTHATKENAVKEALFDCPKTELHYRLTRLESRMNRLANIIAKDDKIYYRFTCHNGRLIFDRIIDEASAIALLLSDFGTWLVTFVDEPAGPDPELFNL